MNIGVGSEVKRILRWFGIHPCEKCHCEQHAIVMDMEGPDWCEDNLEMIIDWLEKEAKNCNYLFSRVAARIVVKWAIRRTRKKLKMLES